MPRRLMGSSKLTYIYACGKVVSASERDALKMKQMHLKMCKVCNDAIEVDQTVIRRCSNSTASVTKNGGVTIGKTAEQIGKEMIEKLMGSD